jgi:predicted DNA-binding transcriptional regulator YafY
LKVDRIDAAEITEFSFPRPADFNMSAYLAGAFGIYTGSGELTVVVKFLPPAARFAQESRWHASQVLTQGRDGSLLARFTLSTTVEIKSWVPGFGANSVVIEPEELRAEIMRELEQMIRVYRAQPISRK